METANDAWLVIITFAMVGAALRNMHYTWSLKRKKRQLGKQDPE